MHNLPKSIGCALAALLAIGCASKPKSLAAFTLVEGAKIGKLSITAIDYENGMGDSLGIKTAQVAKTYSITFDYPGNSISIMKVYRVGKPVKVCDEASYGKLGEWRPTVHGVDGTSFRSKPVVDEGTGREFHPETGEPDLRKRPKLHDIECQIELNREADQGLEITLHESDEVISKYRMGGWIVP